MGEGNGTPLECSCLENPRDGGAWWAAIYGVAQSWTRLSDLAAAAAVDQMLKNPSAKQETSVRSLGKEYSLEKGMATRSSILAYRIPQTEEPGRIQSTGSQRVGHN